MSDRAKKIAEHIKIALDRINPNMELRPFSWGMEYRRQVNEYYAKIKAGGQIDYLLSYDLHLTPEESCEMFGGEPLTTHGKK